MTGMGNKRDIAVFILIVAIMAIFVLGMIYWPSFKKDGTLLGNLYYVTMSSVLYMSSMVWNLLAQKKIHKIGSYLGMAVFGVNLYVELFLDPTHWTNWSFGLVVCVAANLLLYGIIVDKLKNKKQ